MTKSHQRMIEDGIYESLVNGVAVQRVQPHLLDGIDEIDYTWCNTNNHRDTEKYEELKRQHGSSMAWYGDIMEETRMEKWSTTLGTLTRSPDLVMTITAKQQRMYFKPAREIAMQGVRAKRLLREEAEELAKELVQRQSPTKESSPNSLLPPPQGWFVRTNACSPKDSQDDGGAGPHYSLVDALLALMASERVHVTMKTYDVDVHFYLVPYDCNMTVDRELRVFVNRNKVTAISQYDVFNVSSVFSPMDDETLASLAQSIETYHHDKILPIWDGIESYVMDVEFIPDKDESSRIRLIELNSFGAEMASASALFHWIRDSKELHSGKRLCIRVRE